MPSVVYASVTNKPTMLSDVVPNVVMPSVIMLSVVAPFIVVNNTEVQAGAFVTCNLV